MLNLISAPSFTPKRWELEERRTSGVFVVSLSGALLCRIEPPYTLMLWDKRAGIEVAIDVRDLPLWSITPGPPS